MILFKPALHKTNIADNVQELGGLYIKKLTEASCDSMIHTDNVSLETSVAYVQPGQEPNMLGDDILLRKHLLSTPELHLVCPPIRGNPQNCFHNINSMKSLKHPEIRLSACCERMKQFLMVQRGGVGV